MLLYLVNILFTTYTFLLLARVFGSWFASFRDSRAMHFLAFYTDPYLNLFRKIIPPLGFLDISPLFAFLALELLQMMITHFLR